MINHVFISYMEENVLLGTKPFVDSIRHFIRDPSGVFSVCHLCECRIVQWRRDSRLLLLLNWFLHIIKRILHVGSKIRILCSSGKNNTERLNITFTADRKRQRWHFINTFIKLFTQQSQVSHCSNETKMMNRPQKQKSLTIDIPEHRNYGLLTLFFNGLLSIGPSCSNVYVNFTLMHFF